MPQPKKRGATKGPQNATVTVLIACARHTKKKRMPTMIQTAGTKTSKRPWIQGPNIPAKSIVLRANHLPNPYNKLSDLKNENPTMNNIDLVKLFLQQSCATKLAKLVEKGKDAIGPLQNSFSDYVKNASLTYI